VGKATAALGTALVCNAVCVTVAVVAVVGTVATVAYLNAQDQSKVPVSTVKQYRFNLDWVYAGNYCPAVSQAGYEMLSGRYSRCLAGKGGVNACQGRTFDEAKKVASCEAAKGGPPASRSPTWRPPARRVPPPRSARSATSVSART
jgi:predicted ribosomally synthesized peptide with SipW-like signal peptide